MIVWGAVALAVAVSASGSEPARRVVTTEDAVYFEPTEASQSGIVWVYPKTKTVVKRFPQDATYLEVDRVLKDVQLPADPGTVHPAWAGKQAVFYQLTSQTECVLNRTTAMRFVQQFVKAKSVTIPGAQRNPFCTFTFKLTGETPDMVRQLETAAAAGTLVTHDFGLVLAIASGASIPWAPLHTSLVAGGVPTGPPRSSELASFELGLLTETGSLSQQPVAVRRSFMESAMLNLFGWDLVAPEVQLSATAPAGQFDLPGETQTIPL